MRKILFVFSLYEVIYMNTKDILNSNNFVFKKKFGQNFLLDQNILNNIVKEADITKDTLVIEIGVGAAALTKKLSLKAKTIARILFQSRPTANT